MTDLSKIFTQQQTRLHYPPEASLKTQSYFSPNRGFSSKLTSNPSPLPTNSLPVSRDVSISSTAKVVLKRAENPPMHKELAWFKRKNILQGLIKIGILVTILALFYFFDLVSFSLAICFISVCSLALALRHNIFTLSAHPSQIENSRVQAWVFVSLIFSFTVLVNKSFMEIMKIIHLETAEKLNRGDTSLLITLLPSLHISALLGFVFLNDPLISPTPYRNIVENFLSIPSRLIYSICKLFKIKYMFSQCYIGIVLSTFILINILLCGSNSDSSNSSSTPLANNFFSIINLAMNPAVFIAQFITFFLLFMFFNTILVSISDAISEIIIKVNYDQKDEFTRIPYMLELLRVSPLEDLDSLHNQMGVSVANIFSLSSIRRQKDYAYGGDGILLSRHKTELVYRHCLRWVLSALLAHNPNALHTKISTSKFYHKYSDIVGEFAAKELQRCALKVSQMQLLLRNYQVEKRKNKSLTIDLFYPLSLLQKKIKVWFAGVDCVRYLSMVDDVLEILACMRDSSSSPSILKSLKELKETSDQLRNNMLLKQALRDKIQEYFWKCGRAYDSLTSSAL